MTAETLSIIVVFFFTNLLFLVKNLYVLMSRNNKTKKE